MTNKKIIITILFLIIFAIMASIIVILSLQKKRQQENTPPVISLSGEKTLAISVGEKYSEPGYTAKDGDGNDITGDVKVKLPAIKNSGSYKVTYTVTAKNGKSAVAHRTVKVTLPPQTKAGKKRGIAILMYHNVYNEKKPPKKIDANCISSKALEGELKYLKKNNYYFPTWKEVKSYIDGKVDLPKKSVVLTFDDGTELFEKNGVPLLIKYKVPATAFIVGKWNGKHWKKMNYPGLTLQSHSYNMHRPGGKIGHGGIFTALSLKDSVKDLKKSIKILGGNKDAFAYPFGDYNDTCVKALQKAGFLCSVTTKYGKAYPASNPQLLPRIRVNGSPSLSQFVSSIN
ncbi:MAG: polysaccharide deacetylase family protein [Hornefia sp.]|nr:polysaccharide deacetylase family protein [Hornefia sp.]